MLYAKCNVQLDISWRFFRYRWSQLFWSPTRQTNIQHHTNVWRLKNFGAGRVLSSMTCGFEVSMQVLKKLHILTFLLSHQDLTSNAISLIGNDTADFGMIVTELFLRTPTAASMTRLLEFTQYSWSYTQYNLFFPRWLTLPSKLESEDCIQRMEVS